MIKPKLKEVKTEDIIHMCQVIASCKTNEQLEHAVEWAYGLLREWENYDKRDIYKTGVVYDWLKLIHGKYDEYGEMVGAAYENKLKEFNGENMKDKDKLFLVSYLNIASINSSDVLEYIDKFARAIYFDDSVKHLIIPIRDGETRVECINPALLTDEQYKEVEEKINGFKNKFEEILKSLGNE